MELAYAFLARAAEINPTGLSALSADFNQISVSHFPTNIPPLSFVIKISFLPAEVGRHEIQAGFGAAEGNDFNIVGGGVAEVGPNPHNADLPSDAALVLNFGLPVPAAGDYVIRVLVDGRELGRRLLVVSQDVAR
jgi:hypothetical protein